MLQKTITYRDFDDNERTETFRFYLSKAELVEMETGITGGMSEMLRKIVEAQDVKQIIEVFKVFILKAYGEKSPDGRRFIKSQEITDAFVQTEAYSDLFMELSTDAEAALAFIKGLLPQGFIESGTLPSVSELEKQN